MDEIQYASERDLAILTWTGIPPAARGSSRLAPRSGRHLWDLHRLQIADQSETPRCRAVGVALYPLPGVCRPAQARERRLVAHRQPRQSAFQTGVPPLDAAIARAPRPRAGGARDQALALRTARCRRQARCQPPVAPRRDRQRADGRRDWRGDACKAGVFIRREGGRRLPR
jgi:hypothetical protein